MSFDTHHTVSGRQGRVLIIDDEEEVRKPLRLMLCKAGYEVLEAEDGGKAITALNADDNPVMLDAIICDLCMPKVDGTEAISYFRSQYPAVPIIVLTGYPDAEMAVSLIKQGVHDYLVKPALKDDVLRVIRRAVGSRWHSRPR
jgi:two-component system chemotaxis response regulator CheY